MLKQCVMIWIYRVSTTLRLYYVAQSIKVKENLKKKIPHIIQSVLK